MQSDSYRMIRDYKGKRGIDFYISSSHHYPEFNILSDASYDYYASTKRVLSLKRTICNIIVPKRLLRLKATAQGAISDTPRKKPRSIRRFKVY